MPADAAGDHGNDAVFNGGVADVFLIDEEQAAGSL